VVTGEHPLRIASASTAAAQNYYFCPMRHLPGIGKVAASLCDPQILPHQFSSAKIEPSPRAPLPARGSPTLPIPSA